MPTTPTLLICSECGNGNYTRVGRHVPGAAWTCTNLNCDHALAWSDLQLDDTDRLIHIDNLLAVYTVEPEPEPEPEPCEVDDCDHPATPCECGAAHCAQHPHDDEDEDPRADALADGVALGTYEDHQPGCDFAEGRTGTCTC